MADDVAKVAAGDGRDRYRRHRERAGRVQAEQSRQGRDIGAIPPVLDPERRAACERNFRLFCETYLGDKFPLAWSEDHLQGIRRIEDAVLSGELFAFAMPRGSGKTSLVEAAVIWCTTYGHRLFIVLIGADEAAAIGVLENIKVELEANDALLEDFPEVCHPIRCLEGIANRCAGQTYAGQRTRIGWRDKEIILPTIPGSRASGCCVRARGITGRIRGMKRTLPDGRTLRPDFVVIDDPQTDESAASPSQCQKRINVLMGAVLGLAGPGQKIAGVMPCTVIAPDDMADQILDREKYPQWQGLRTKLLVSFPTDLQLWEEYAKRRAEGLRRGDGGKEATEFYASHRAAMDAGARAAWEARRNPDELSAVQHAMNLYFQSPATFYAEYQNQPQRVEVEEKLQPAQVAAKINRLDRRLVPSWCDLLTAYIDVSKKLLWYGVAAWKRDDFAGAVIDYGAFPDQKRSYFTLSDAKRTLARRYPGHEFESTLYAGLDELVGELAGREWPRDGGGVVRLGKILVDANWGDSTDTVYQLCRQSKHAALLMPAHGKYLGAGSQPFAEYKRKEGETLGHHWWIPARKKRPIRHVMIDTNYWKSFVVEGLRAALGGARSISLFGDSPELHRMFADQICAENPVPKTVKGRTVVEWAEPKGADNHMLDILAGMAAAASMLGSQLPGPAGAKPNRRRGPRVRYFT